MVYVGNPWYIATRHSWQLVVGANRFNSPRNASKNLKAIVCSVHDKMVELEQQQLRMEQTHTRSLAGLEDFLSRMSSMSANQQALLEGGYDQPVNLADAFRASSEQNSLNLISDDTSLPTTRMSDYYSALPRCKCRCHQRALKRSSFFIDRFLGTVFTAYSGIPHLVPGCNVLSCTQSCLISEMFFSFTYFFPTWLISWAIILVLRRSTLGFDHNIRLLHCVSYSSPIFQCAYQGDVVGMKLLLHQRLGSPFDVTPEPQRSLLGVGISFLRQAS